MKFDNKYFFLIAFLIIAIDQLSKSIFSNKQFTIIKNFLYITPATNSGGAFSLFQGFNFLLIIVSIAVLVILFYYRARIKDDIEQLAFSFMSAGVFSNLIDRIFLGFVRDFIDFRIWPVFNFADSFVVIGLLILVIYIFKQH